MENSYFGFSYFEKKERKKERKKRLKEFRNELKKDEKVLRGSVNLVKKAMVTRKTTTKAPETELSKGTPMNGEEEARGCEESVGTTI